MPAQILLETIKSEHAKNGVGYKFRRGKTAYTAFQSASNDSFTVWRSHDNRADIGMSCYFPHKDGWKTNEGRTAAKFLTKIFDFVVTDVMHTTQQ